MAQMTREVSKLLEQALSLSVEEKGRWRIPRFSTSVASWVKEYKRPGKPRAGGESQNWSPARHKPLLGRRCAGAIWRSCLMPTSLAKFHDEPASEYDAAFDWYLARSPEAHSSSTPKRIGRLPRSCKLPSVGRLPRARLAGSCAWLDGAGIEPSLAGAFRLPFPTLDAGWK